MITVTDQAATHIRQALADRKCGLGIRLGVKTAGCSGMAYYMEFVDRANDDDVKFEQAGVIVFVDVKSMPYLAGTELDFGKEGLNTGFKFNNPNVVGQCGCGESFTV